MPWNDPPDPNDARDDYLSPADDDPLEALGLPGHIARDIPSGASASD